MFLAKLACKNNCQTPVCKLKRKEIKTSKTIHTKNKLLVKPAETIQSNRLFGCFGFKFSMQEKSTEQMLNTNQS